MEWYNFLIAILQCSGNIDSGKDHQWMLKPIGEKLLGRDGHMPSKYHPTDYLSITKHCKSQNNGELSCVTLTK